MLILGKVAHRVAVCGFGSFGVPSFRSPYTSVESSKRRTSSASTQRSGRPERGVPGKRAWL